MGDIRLTKRGRRIEIRSPTPLTGMKTAIPGAYLTTGGYWTAPLSLETCKLLRDKFGARLEIDIELRRWAKSVSTNRKYMAGLAASEDATLEVLPHVAPKLAKATRKRRYQRVGIRFIADATAPLVADDPGLGKTLQVMGSLLEAEIPGPYLIIAPKTAADSVWKREITRWLPRDHRAVTLPEMRHAREKTIRLSRYGPKTWLIVHPEIVLVQAYWVCATCGKRTIEGAKQKRDLDCGHIRDQRTKKLTVPAYPRLFETEWGAVILDEAHESLIRRKGVPTQRRRGLDMLPVREDGKRIAISGTPFYSHPELLWGTLNWLDAKTHPAYHRWAEMFWRKGGYTGHEIGEFITEREGMLWSSLDSIVLRRTKAEVAKDLPPKMYVGTPLNVNDPHTPVGVWLDMEPKQAAAYEAMEKASIAELDSGRLEAVTALAELTRLKQLACAYGRVEERLVKVKCRRNPKRYPVPCRSCNEIGWHVEVRNDFHPELPSNKFTWTVEALEEWGYPRDPLTKVVIVSWYTGILERFGAGIEKHFRTKSNRPLCTAITGRTPPDKRRAVIDQFNRRDKNSPQVMLLNVKAGGTAITLDTADRMIFISETRIPDQQRQAEDRIHRISNPRQCMYYYLRSLGTVDVGTALANQELDQQSHRLLDGRRGIDYMRHVLDLSKAS